MKRSVVILIMFLANATFLWGQTMVVTMGVDNYAGQTSVDDGFGGTWNVEQTVYVTGTGKERKEHSVYVLRRPSNMTAELPDTSACKSKIFQMFPKVRPATILSKEATYFSYGDVTIRNIPNSELLMYWWRDSDAGNIKEVAYWFPVKSIFASVKPGVYTSAERDVKRVRRMTKDETERFKAYETAISQFDKDSTAQDQSWYRDLYRPQF